ncbi:MAG: hypothetical protein U5K71_13240 [Gracilimonas sp.]|nr:hypothetical protein [Gracilimonas sp.]
MKQDGFKIIAHFLLFTLIITISACGTVKRGSYTEVPRERATVEEDASPELEPMISVSEAAPDVVSERQEILQLAYSDWKGIPYILGGTGYNGIDCSAFMQVVYEDYFSVITATYHP